MFKYISIFIISAGIIMDIGVNCTGIYLFALPQEYLYALFAAIVTVAILCFTIITLIFGAIDRSYMGYKFGEIIRFKKSKINMKRIICVSAVHVVVAVTVLFLSSRYNTYNSMTSLMFSLLLYEGRQIYMVYNLITNEELLFEIVNEYLKGLVDSKSSIVINSELKRLESALKDSLLYKNKEQTDIVGEFLKVLLQSIENLDDEEKRKLKGIFKKNISDNLELFAKNYGYNEMINYVNKLYANIETSNYEKEDLYLVPLEKIRFYSSEELLKMSYFNEFRSFRGAENKSEQNINDDTIKFIMNFYFDQIMKNEIGSEKVKYDLIEDFINQSFYKICYVSGEGKLYQDLLISILIEHILKNNNDVERNKLFLLFLKYTNIHIRNDRESFGEFMTLFFQLFYSAIFQEKEVLSNQHREKLKETFKQKLCNEFVNPISASDILESQIEIIFGALSERILKFEEYPLTNRYEMYPDFIKIKHIVWTRNADIKFMLFLYLLSPYSYPSMTYLFGTWNEVPDENKINVIISFKKCFDKGEKLNASFKKEYNAFLDLLQKSYKVTDDKAKGLFDEINKEHKALIEKGINGYNFDSDLHMTDNNLFSQLKEIINEDAGQHNAPEWDENCREVEKLQINIAPFYLMYKTISKKSLAADIINIIKVAADQKIRSCRNSSALDDLVQNVEKQISEKGTFKFVNTNITDLWNFQKYKDKPEAKALEKELQNISVVETPFISEIVFFNYNLKLRLGNGTVKVDQFDVDDCLKFLENEKAYNGMYNVQGALFSKDEAIEVVKKYYRKVTINFELVFGFTDEDIHRITVNI